VKGTVGQRDKPRGGGFQRTLRREKEKMYKKERRIHYLGKKKEIAAFSRQALRESGEHLDRKLGKKKKTKDAWT